MKYTVDLTAQKVLGPHEGSPSANGASANLSDFIDKLADKTPYKTGLIPNSGTGLLSIQKAFGHEQYIYQLEPAIDKVRWSESEGDKDKPIYELAMPYRVIIADFVDNAFLGARHFWSPEAIFHWDQKLYCVPLPNTNIVGYRGTSIGWICLYRNDDTTKMSTEEKIHYFLGRVNGIGEPYNDRNMSSTDGPRFYLRYLPASIFANREAWAVRTKEEGFLWTLDNTLVVEAKTRAGIDHHNEVYARDGASYTLNRAANEPYSAYYDDTNYVKNFMKKTSEISSATFSQSFIGTKALSGWQVPDNPNQMRVYFNNTTVSLRLTSAIMKLLAGPPMVECQFCHSIVKERTTKSAISHVNALPDGGLTFAKHACCENCIAAMTVEVPGYGYVLKKYVALTYPHMIYRLAHEIKMCQYCSAAYHQDEVDDYMLYNSGKNHLNPTQKFCFNCYAGEFGLKQSNFEQDVLRDYFSGKLMMANTMRTHIVRELESDLESGAIKVVEKTVHVPNGISPCRCGMFMSAAEMFKVDGVSDVCMSCFDGETKCYVPAFDFHNTPVGVSTSQLVKQS